MSLLGFLAQPYQSPSSSHSYLGVSKSRCMLAWNLPVEVVPEDTRGIFVNTHVCSNIDRVIFDHGPASILPYCEELADFCKSGEAPVPFVGVKSVSRSYVRALAR